MTNEIKLIFDSLSINEGFARMAVAAAASMLNPTLEELSDLKTAVSEAVTNAVIHGYNNGPGKIEMIFRIRGMELTVTVRDQGCGIADVEQAMEPLFTTRPDLERSGMGFAFMEAFMDDIEVLSAPGEGTSITMMKKIGASPENLEAELNYIKEDS